MVYGAQVGSSAYVDHKLREVAREIVEDNRKTKEVLGGDRQALWSALRLSISQRFGYLQQMVPPSLTEPVAAKLDRCYGGCLRECVDSWCQGGRGRVVSLFQSLRSLAWMDTPSRSGQ